VVNNPGKAFTSYQWTRNVPLEMIKKMVGHSPNSRVTEAHYLHLPDEAVKQAFSTWSLPDSTE